MRMRDKGETFRIPGIQPQILIRKVNAALVSDLNHRRYYARNRSVVTRKKPGACIDTSGPRRLGSAMKTRAAMFAIVLLTAAATHAREAPRANEYRQLTTVNRLPTALDPAFEFRKTKLFAIGDAGNSTLAPSFIRGAGRPAPMIDAEAAYRLHGAVSMLEQRRRYGHYFDFFWRVKRPANVTVRLEYRQARLHAFTQAREVDYPNAKGSYKTAFAIIGDDFFNDGRVMSWRCLLIENGRIVAEDRSFLWR